MRDRLARAADAVGQRPAARRRRDGGAAGGDRAADRAADVADFFSLGTNDLTAGALGLDRTDPRLTPAAAADPRVLRLVERAVLVGAGRPAAVAVRRRRG